MLVHALAALPCCSKRKASGFSPTRIPPWAVEPRLLGNPNPGATLIYTVQ